MKPSAARWLGAALLVACVLAVYHPVGDFGFVTWDDPFYVQHNKHVQGGLSMDGVHWALTSARLANWHPLTWLSHMLDVELFGDDAGGHHLTSALLHLATTCLLFAALGRMTGAWGRAWFVAALWACHPLRAESVAWISERKDVLSGACFAGLLLALDAHARAPSWRRLAGVAGLLLVGLAAKSMLVTVPALAFLLAAWPLGRRVGGWLPAAPATALRPALGRSRLLLECALLAVPALVVAAVTLNVQGDFGAVASDEVLPFSLRWRHAVLAPWTYLRQLVWPHDLSFFRPLPDPPPSVAQAALAAAGLVAVTAALLVGRLRRQPWLATGWLWFLGMLVPVSGWVQVGSQATADRYTYLPTIGIVWAAVWTLAESWRARRWPAVGPPLLGLAALAALVLAARPQVMTWRSSWRLYQHAVSLDPDNGLAQLQLAMVLDRRGDAEAGAHFERALALRPRYAKAHSAHGEHLVGRGDLPGAQAALERAVALDPQEYPAWMRLAEVRQRSGDLAAARDAAGQALSLRPHLPETVLLAAELALAADDQVAARQLLRAGLERQPDEPRLRAALAQLKSRRR